MIGGFAGVARECPGCLVDTEGSHQGRVGLMPPDHVHFNGSVNLADSESVMREIATREARA